MYELEDRDLVHPGTLIGENVNCSEHAFVEGDKVYSNVSGMIRINKDRSRIIPSLGAYLPKNDDLVIGVISEVMGFGWIVDINSPYDCIMMGEEGTKDPMNEDLSEYYDIGDRLSAKVRNVNEVYDFDLIKPWKLHDGIIITVNPKRIPRVVGKRRSMLEILRKKTGASIVVGQNGRIWIKHKDSSRVNLAIEAIKKIEREAQTRGLTDRIEKMLEKRRNE